MNGLAGAIQQYRRERQVFPIVIGMERLDRGACAQIAQRLGGAPIFDSDHYDIYQLVSILRCASRIVSSRYHAIVTSMAAGIPSAGVTMDERIRNLMDERGHNHLFLEADDPALEENLVVILKTLDRDEESIGDEIRRTVARNLRVMARMGVQFEECLARCYPEFPVRQGRLSWEDYLPPLSPALRQLAEEYC